MTQPLFSLDVSLAIAFGLLALVLAALVYLVAQYGCAHEWTRRYDFETKRAYLSSLRCNAKTPGWRYGQRQSDHGKDAA